MYTIRFQNTGTDTAYTIIIRDTLDVNLDVNTFTITGASHPVRTIILQDRIVEFQFNSIFLPNSVVNEPKSHGFISYRIKPKTVLPAPVVIYNTAHIYFDFDFYEITNTTLNELGEYTTNLFPVYHSSPLIRLFPNPALNDLFLTTLPGALREIQFEILNFGGIPIYSGNLSPGATHIVAMNSFPDGSYYVRAFQGGFVHLIPFIKQ